MKYELSASNIMMMKLLAVHIHKINNDVIAFYCWNVLSAAFLYGYLYDDTLTSDRVSYQLYTIHAVMLYAVL